MKTITPTAEEFFASKGLDEDGNPINAKAKRVDGDETIYDLDRFTSGQFDDHEVSRDCVEDIEQAAERAEKLAATYKAQGKPERVKEYEQDARELRQLAAFTARNTFRIHALFSEAFAHAVNGGNPTRHFLEHRMPWILTNIAFGCLV